MKLSGRAVFIASMAVASALGLLFPRVGIPFTPWLFVTGGIIAFAVLNMVLFSINLLVAFTVLKGKSEEEAEQILVPAMQGDVRHIGLKLDVFFGILAVACFGFLVAGVVLLILKWCGIGP